MAEERNSKSSCRERRRSVEYETEKSNGPKASFCLSCTGTWNNVYVVRTRQLLPQHVTMSCAGRLAVCGTDTGGNNTLTAPISRPVHKHGGHNPHTDIEPKDLGKGQSIRWK